MGDVLRMKPEESAESILYRYGRGAPFSVEEMHRVLSVNCGHDGLTIDDTRRILDDLCGAKAVKVDGGYIAGPHARQR